MSIDPKVLDELERLRSKAKSGDVAIGDRLCVGEETATPHLIYNDGNDNSVLSDWPDEVEYLCALRNAAPALLAAARDAERLRAAAEWVISEIEGNNDEHDLAAYGDESWLGSLRDHLRAALSRDGGG